MFSHVKKNKTKQNTIKISVIVKHNKSYANKVKA